MPLSLKSPKLHNSIFNQALKQALFKEKGNYGELQFKPKNNTHRHGCFFAQVEQRSSRYKNKPLIVGGPLNRGVISSASYEARKFGLHAGMPLSRAKRLCPKGIFVPVDMEKYLEESRKIRQIFFQFTPLVEIVGCDEGFLDVTGCEKLFGSDLEIAKKIKGKIYEQTIDILSRYRTE
jgi:nucleotidyltransferase/DNA polymerase involved in DNA repair